MNQNGSINDISSKSLLANVLDMNDEFGVIASKPSFFTRDNKSKSKLFNENLVNSFSNYHSSSGNIYSKRDNCENCGESLYNHNNVSTTPSIKCDSSYPLRKNLHAILKELRLMTKKIKDDGEDEEKELNWKFAAMVIDRLCMWIFAIATFFSTTLILLTSKNFFKFK